MKTTMLVAPTRLIVSFYKTQRNLRKHRAPNVGNVC